jgi:hypothetical protein
MFWGLGLAPSALLAAAQRLYFFDLLFTHQIRL